MENTLLMGFIGSADCCWGSYWAFIGEGVSHSTLVIVEGLAAGAMLTMICAAMLPEAAHLADNNLVGLATLAGFLASVLFKLLSEIPTEHFFRTQINNDFRDGF